jgi:hypothetical protein
VDGKVTGKEVLKKAWIPWSANLEGYSRSHKGERIAIDNDFLFKTLSIRITWFLCGGVMSAIQIQQELNGYK